METENIFAMLMQFFFGWLPEPLWKPVWAILGAAFLVILIKILTAIVNLVTKVIGIFI